jgi:hypothetical protein
MNTYLSPCAKCEKPISGGWLAEGELLCDDCYRKQKKGPK